MVKCVAGNLWLSMLVCLCACSFERDNPNDIENPDFVRIVLDNDDGLVWTSDSVYVAYALEGAAESVCWRMLLEEGSGAWKCADAPLTDSLVIGGLDDGDYSVELMAKGKTGKSFLDTLSFSVDAVSGPALVLVPRTLLVAQDSVFAVSLYFDEVRSVLGANVWLRWDSSKLEYVRTESDWQAMADTHGKDSLELGLVELSSKGLFSGSKSVARVYFRAKIQGGGAIDVLPDSYLSTGSGERLDPAMVRGSIGL